MQTEQRMQMTLKETKWQKKKKKKKQTNKKKANEIQSCVKRVLIIYVEILGYAHSAA